MADRNLVRLNNDPRSSITSRGVFFGALVVLALLSIPCRCEEQPSTKVETNEISDLLNSLKSPRAGAAFSYFDDKWHKDAVGYWTLAQLGSKGLRYGEASAVPYLDLDFGISGTGFNDVRLFLPLMIHPANIAGPLIKKISPNGRLSVREIPKWLELGPALRYCPEKAINKQRIMEAVSFVAAYKFGG